jgi:hypothetical protein
MIRTTRSTVVFKHPFTLTESVGELPSGEYAIEVDEEELGPAADRTAHRRVAVYFYVTDGTSTRTIVIEPTALAEALETDAG